MSAALDLGPFQDTGFRADLELLATSTRQGWQRWASEAVIVSRLAAQVPREAVDRIGDLAWKSFVREIAVLRRSSDQAAGKEIYLAVALTTSFPRTLSLLQAGQLPRYQAQVLLEEAAGCSPEVIAAVDAEVADRAVRMTPSRIKAAVRKIELRYDADAAAAESATAAAARGTQLLAQPDGQASLILSGPALPVVAFYEALSAAARAARAAGDPRGLDALRFDLALGATPPASDLLPDLTPEPAPDAAPDPDQTRGERSPQPVVGDALLPAWVGDRRRLRPVQVLIHLPVTTALGLSNEPGWLAGYGWITAPQCRQWLVDAELRQVCVDRSSGQVVDLADRAVRPDPTPTGARTALLDMVRDPGPITDKTWRTEPHHDPSPALAAFIDVRDQHCDGPTASPIPATRCDTDHDQRYPDGPTAAWNLIDRSRRTHLLKHHGWVPLRTANSTLWFSPAGQIVEVERSTAPPPDLDPHAWLPDPDELHHLEAQLLHIPEDQPPFDEPPPF